MNEVLDAVETTPEFPYNRANWKCSRPVTSKEQMDGATDEVVYKAKFEDFFLARVKRGGEYVTAMFVIWTTPNRRTVYERLAPVQDMEDFDMTRMDSILNGLQVADEGLTEVLWLNNMTILPSRRALIQDVVRERLDTKLDAIVRFTATLDDETDLDEVKVPACGLWKSVLA